MFRRRIPRTPLQNLKELFWPSMGWIRACKYVKHRVVRLSDSSHKIAKGLAIGASISFSPIVGTHFIQAGVIAYFARGNIIASLIGTFVGTPWTFPFIWLASINLGAFIFDLFGFPASTSLPETMDIYLLWSIAKSQPLRLFLPWLVGGYTLALLTWPFWYVLAFFSVRGAKAARKTAHLRKVHKVAREITGQAQ